VHIHQVTQGATQYLLKSVRQLTESRESLAYFPAEATQPYHQNLYSVSHNGRWIAEREQNSYSRDRRTDRRSNFPQTHAQRPAHHSSFSHGFGGSSGMTQPPTYQASYARQNDMQHSISSWESWDMHPDPNFSVGHIRRFDEKASSWIGPVTPQIPSMVPQQFNNLIVPSEPTSSPSLYAQSEQPNPLDGFNFPHRLSPLPSPTPSPIQEDVKPIIAPLPSNGQQSRRKPSDGSESGKTCSHCHATSTPLWRRDPSTMKPLCNACGLYLQQRNKLRPQELIDADDDGSSSEESDANYLGPECSHCRTHRTSVWRRSKSGDQLCNACGVYARLRGKPRPLSLKKNKIRPRSKHSAK
jgi:hypothetical protein